MRNFYNYRYPRGYGDTGIFPHGRLISGINRQDRNYTLYGAPDIGGYEIELMTDLLRRQRREREVLEKEIMARRYRDRTSDSDEHYGRSPSDRSVVELDQRFLDEYDYDSGERAWYNRVRDAVASWMGDENAEHRRELDAYFDGNRGKGPKNYVRSDMRIIEDIGDLLTDDPFVDATDITVAVKEGMVELKGSVPSRHSKRRAEDLAYCVSGVKDVRDEMWIDPEFYRNAEATGSDTDSAANEKSMAHSG